MYNADDASRTEVPAPSPFTMEMKSILKKWKFETRLKIMKSLCGFHYKTNDKNIQKSKYWNEFGFNIKSNKISSSILNR